MRLRLCTWNVNSVRLRAEQVARFVSDQAPDVVCLQEIKCQEAEFPTQAFVDMGLPHIKIAGQNSDVQFLHCGGLWKEGKTPNNIGTYFGFIDEGQYIAGIVAALPSALVQTLELGRTGAHGHVEGPARRARHAVILPGPGSPPGPGPPSAAPCSTDWTVRPDR